MNMLKNLQKLSLNERDQQSVWHPFTPYKSIADIVSLVKGEGVYLIDEKGKQYIDAVASWWVNLHGHGHPHLAEAIYKQALKLEHTIFAGFTHEPAIVLAERLKALTNKGYDKVFFSDNGSTSVEVALKLAIQYYFNQNKNRTKILALQDAYHGDTFGAMSVAERNVFSLPFHSYLFDTTFIHAQSEINKGTDYATLETMLQTGEYAAFIFEPLVQGASGMKMYSADWLNQAMKICKKFNVLTIADEVFTGFYRTGKPFASSYLSETPDLMCLSKGLTGGMMALGATLIKPEVIDAFKKQEKRFTFFHGHSFTANPLACAAANASLDLIEKPDFVKNVRRIEKLFFRYAQHFKQSPKIKHVRTMGLIFALEIKTNEESNYMNPLSERATPFFLKKGFYIRPLGNVIYVTPPVCITNDQIDDIMMSIEAFLDTVKV